MSGVDPRAWRMSEDELQEEIRALCASMHLSAQHVHDSRRCWLPGWPDLFIIGPRGVLARELKSEDGKLSPDQRTVGAKLICAGVSWAVWRPRDLFAGVVAEQLEGIARLGRAA